MGVPGFSTWFSSAICPQAFVELRAKSFDHVLIDLASVLHSVFRHARSRSRVHKQLYVEIDKILLRCQPRKSVLLAVDGPAPLAKLITQRSRRTAVSRREVRRGAKGLSSLNLTPGTSFMLELEDSLTYYITQRLETSWSHLHFELSGAAVAGEGETKIFGRLLDAASRAAPAERVAIVGSDSDLYLMALIHRASSDLWIVPEHEYDARAMRALKSFSLTALERHWSQSPPVKGSGSGQAALQRLASVKWDLAAVAILANGNDYLPGMLNASLETNAWAKGLWDAYLHMRSAPAWKDRSLVVRAGAGPRLDLEFLAALLDSYAGQGRDRPKPERDGWTLRKPSPDPELYIRGMDWVLDMYSNGSCPDFRYMYDSQAPTALEVLDHIGREVQGARGRAAAEEEAGAALLPAVCALALLPPGRAGDLAPPVLRPLMAADSPIADLYRICSECERLVEAVKHSASELGQVQRGLTELNRAVNGPSEAKDALTRKVARLRTALRQHEDARLGHVLEAHPYERFPVGRIEEAVAALPGESFVGSERELLRFGEATVFWRKREDEACCCRSCREGGRATACLFCYPEPKVPGPGLKQVSTDDLRRRPVLPETADARLGDHTSTSCRCPACMAQRAEDGQGALMPRVPGLGGSRLARQSTRAQPAASSTPPPFGWFISHRAGSRKTQARTPAPASATS